MYKEDGSNHMRGTDADSIIRDEHKEKFLKDTGADFVFLFAFDKKGVSVASLTKGDKGVDSVGIFSMLHAMKSTIEQLEKLLELGAQKLPE